MAALEKITLRDNDRPASICAFPGINHQLIERRICGVYSLLRPFCVRLL